MLPRHTRNVEAFLKKTAIASHQNLAPPVGFGWCAIAVSPKNALRVPAYQHRCMEVLVRGALNLLFWVCASRLV